MYSSRLLRRTDRPGKKDSKTYKFYKTIKGNKIKQIKTEDIPVEKNNNLKYAMALTCVND